MAYKSFKEYIENNYSELLRNEIEGFVQEHHCALPSLKDSKKAQKTE